MRECGVGEPLSQWFSDYLTARSYRVKVGSTVGDEQAVRCGVPQGSGCGPVCYLLHVNSLCGVLRHCSPHMFADDLCVLRAGAADDLAGVCRAVQQDVDAVLKWSHDNGIRNLKVTANQSRASNKKQIKGTTAENGEMNPILITIERSVECLFMKGEFTLVRTEENYETLLDMNYLERGWSRKYTDG
ncbi:uncharacterized protein LOC125236756 [Leguminivora glycinivorella]|uniref:uncharacterized protein LOC125236756 n=1 Tax=Leguminivora glycinivorella TaxID=1035111 RepID=UPI00200C3EBE|nr:uncharacterized protein LOC125236756 [Leguminivora glycinivorella]